MPITLLAECHTTRAPCCGMAFFKGSALRWPLFLLAGEISAGAHCCDNAPSQNRSARHAQISSWEEAVLGTRAIRHTCAYALPRPMWIAVLVWLKHPLVFESSRNDFKCYERHQTKTKHKGISQYGSHTHSPYSWGNQSPDSWLK
jgi:hypothetical protein